MSRGDSSFVAADTDGVPGTMARSPATRTTARPATRDRRRRTMKTLRGKADDERRLKASRCQVRLLLRGPFTGDRGNVPFAIKGTVHRTRFVGVSAPGH